MNSGGSCLLSPHLQEQGCPFPVLLPTLSELYFIFRYPQITLDALGSARLQVVDRTGAEQQQLSSHPEKCHSRPETPQSTCLTAATESKTPLQSHFLLYPKERRNAHHDSWSICFFGNRSNSEALLKEDQVIEIICNLRGFDFSQGVLSIILLFQGQKYNQMILGAEGKAQDQKQAGTTLRGAKQLEWPRGTSCRARRDIHPQAGPSSPSACTTTTLANQLGPNLPLCLAASG